jgi:hypothetical protein
MTGRRPHLTPLIAGSALAGLVLGSLAFTTANAAPEPAPAAAAVEPKPGDADYPAAPAGSVVRVKLAEEFRADLESGGAVIVGTGATTVDGALLEIPIDITFKDGFALAGGFALQVDGKTTYSCPDISVWTEGKTIYCGKDGKTKPTFTYGEPEKTERAGAWQTQSGMNVRILNDRRADQMNNELRGEPLVAEQLVGDMTIVSKRLLRGWDGDTDSRTGCWIGYYAGDTSIWRGWAIQAMVNRIPGNVGMSQFADGKLAGPAAPAVTIGQRTPHLEGISVNDSKKIIRGTERNTDHFFSAPSYGCNTNAPYIVSQGLLDAKDVKAWRYDGGLRTAASNNPGGPARPQWWGHARQTDYNGPTGFYTWTCRGLPANQSSSSANTGGDTYWQTVDQGTGFRGDAGESDRAERASGSAPACQDLNLNGMKLTTRYSISKRGGLEARNDQVEYPRYCSVEGASLVGCWQEIYPLWDRAWAFQYHVYASALRANISSVTQIKVPSAFDDSGVGFQRPITWRITDGNVTGAWPDYIGANGAQVDMAGIAKTTSQQDWSQVSPFTVPGTGEQFTVSGYGTPMGPQEMSFILTADTDGTWRWPVNAKTGRELTRPQIKVTLNFTISNYDDGESCKDKVWYDNDAFGSGRNNDSSGAHCIQGSVPTIWPLPEDKRQLWKRVYDETIVDKDGKKIRNTPTVAFDYSVLASCLQSKELVVQDNSRKTAPAVGADFAWDIRLAGTVSSFSGC